MTDDQRLTRSSDWVLMGVIGAVLLSTVVAFVKPEWAVRIALICAVLAACGAAAWWLISMISRTMPERRAIDTTRPDNPDDDDDQHDDRRRRTTQPSPLAVNELRHAQGIAGLSAQGLRYLQFVATERLWANHRLNLAYAPHHQLIQARITPELWHVLRGQPHPHYTQLPLAALLQEIERL